MSFSSESSSETATTRPSMLLVSVLSAFTPYPISTSKPPSKNDLDDDFRRHTITSCFWTSLTGICIGGRTLRSRTKIKNAFQVKFKVVTIIHRKSKLTKTKFPFRLVQSGFYSLSDEKRFKHFEVQG